MTADAAQLSRAVFVADLTPQEKSPLRFSAVVVLGVVAFIVAAFVGVVVSFAILVGFFGWPAPTSLENLRAMLSRFIQLAASDGRSLSEAYQLLAVAIPDNVLPIFAMIGVAALIHQRPLRAYITSAPRFRWPMLAAGLALSALFIGPYVAVSQLMDPHAAPPPVLTVSRDPALNAIYAMTCVGCFFLAALGEEMLFRGWLLRETSALIRNTPLLLAINGVVFAAAHLQFAPDAFLERAILGAAFAYMTLRLGGVEFSTGAHLANNLMIVLFLEPLTLKAPPSSGVSLDAVIQDVVLVVSYVAMTELTVRWLPLRRWTGADIAAPQRAAVAAGIFS